MTNIEKVARVVCTHGGSNPDALEPGNLPKIDGYIRDEPCHYRWRDFTVLAKKVLKSLSI